MPLGQYHLHIWGCWYFSWQSWFQLVIHPARHFTWCTLHMGFPSGGAAPAAKSLQSCPTLCDPRDGNPPGSPWDSPGKKTGVGCHFLLQGIFPTQGSNSCFPHCRQDSLPSKPPGNPYMQSTSWKMLDWMNYKLEWGRNINNLRYADDATLMEESKEELKCLFMRMQEWKAGLKLDIQKSKIMASNPIISWQKDGGKMETFLGLQNHWGQWLQPWN